MVDAVKLVHYLVPELSLAAHPARSIQGHLVFEFNTDESQCLRRLGCHPAQAAAMFVWPDHLSSPIAVLRSAAISCGMLPLRT